MSAVRYLRADGPTVMVSVLIRHVAVTQRCDVKVGRDLLDLDTPIHAAGGAIIHLVVGRAILGVRFLHSRLACKQSSDTRDAATLIRRVSLGRRDDL